MAVGDWTSAVLRSIVDAGGQFEVDLGERAVMVVLANRISDAPRGRYAVSHYLGDDNQRADHIDDWAVVMESVGVACSALARGKEARLD